MPAGERGLVIEAYMQQALLTREQEVQGIAADFIHACANAQAHIDKKRWDVTMGDGLIGVSA